MSLPAREQQVLDGIETVLQDGAAGLTSMFVLFTRLAADEEKPRVEELGLPSRRSLLPLPREADGLPADARLRSLARGRLGLGGSGERLRLVILLTMLAAAIGCAVVLSMRTTSMRACVPAAVTYAPGSAPSQPPACPSSPSAPTPTRIP
jgi:hypothetical protein